MVAERRRSVTRQTRADVCILNPSAIGPLCLAAALVEALRDRATRLREQLGNPVHSFHCATRQFRIEPSLEVTRGARVGRRRSQSYSVARLLGVSLGSGTAGRLPTWSDDLASIRSRVSRSPFRASRAIEYQLGGTIDHVATSELDVTALRILCIIAGFMLSLVLHVSALSNLSEAGRATRADVIAKGILTKRAYFTRTGWRYLWLGRAIGSITLLIAGYLLITAG